MAKDQKNISGVAENLVLVTEKLQDTFPNGKLGVVIELQKKEFFESQINFDMLENVSHQFKIEISDVEFIFICDELYKVEEKPKEEPEKPKKKSKLKNFLNLFISEKSS